MGADEEQPQVEDQARLLMTVEVLAEPPRSAVMGSSTCAWRVWAQTKSSPQVAGTAASETDPGQAGEKRGCCVWSSRTSPAQLLAPTLLPATLWVPVAA